LLTGLLFVGTARANGAFPEVNQLLADPSDATRLVLRSNFGLLTTRDNGQNWDLVCEGGIGYQNIEPPIALLDDGSTIAALSTGIAHGDPSACNFSVASGVTSYIADVSRVPGVPAHAIAVAVDLTTDISQIWQSTDDGATWSTFGVPIADMNASTLDVAADDPNVVYVSGTAQTGTLHGVLARTADGGQTWTQYAVPLASKVSAPYIAALSALDHQVVYPTSDAATPGSDASLVNDAGQVSHVVTPVVLPGLAPHGGCGCGVAGRAPEPEASWLALASLGLGFVRSRRPARKSRRFGSRRQGRC
jgi:MYXO-CTERM domain-containing protein